MPSIIDSNQTITDAPYIEKVQGTALIGELCTINVYGQNFTPECSVICAAGDISNVKLSPNLIKFDVIATNPGSYPLTIKNFTVDSNIWSTSSQSLLIARNSLNLTNGWIDFRTITNPSNIKARSDFNSNQPETNQLLSNSGYYCDPIRGLYRGNTAQSGVNTNTSFLKFFDYSFDLNSDCTTEFVCAWSSAQVVCGQTTPEVQQILNLLARYNVAVTLTASPNTVHFIAGAGNATGSLADYNQSIYRRDYAVGSSEYLKIQIQGTRNGGIAKYFKVSNSTVNDWNSEINLLQERTIDFCFEGMTTLCPGVTIFDPSSPSSILGLRIF